MSLWLITLQAQELVYICPMDPGVRQGAPGDCPLCGMKLIPSAPGDYSEYRLKVDSSPRAIHPVRPVTLTFRVFHPRTGELVPQFAWVHEKQFHLFIIRGDMEYFAHEHPQLQADGSFVLKTKLPRAGHYQLIADFFPQGGTPQTIQRALMTAGYRAPVRPAALVPDSQRVREVNGLNVELKGERLLAGRPVLLMARLTDAATGQPVTDLEQYLGAWGHMLVLSADFADAVHVHPAPDTKSGGPEVRFDARFPRPGDYRIWMQFQRKGQVTTVAFTVRAEEVGAEFSKQ